jgi:methionyl-tRNA formyltransferase
MVSASPLRVVFFGTPSFAVPTLDALLASRHRVAGIVTQPDRPRGRGQKTSDAPVKARAAAAGLPVLQPTRLKDSAFLEQLAAMDADIGVVAAYGRILTDAVLETPRRGMVNVHASLLPRYRGAAPVHRAVIAGESETGVTIMKVVTALDAGPMLAHRTRAIGPNDTSDDVERDLANLGASLLVGTLDRIAAGDVSETLQDETLATYANRLTRADGLINWQWPAYRIHNLVRGLHPWPHAHTFLHDQRLIIRRTTVARQESPIDALPGTIVAARGAELRVAAGEAAIDIIEIQAEGKRPMAVREFLAGHRLRAGDRLTLTP